MDAERGLLASESERSTTKESPSPSDSDATVSASDHRTADGAPADQGSATPGSKHLSDSIDYEVYANTLHQVLDDPELPLPITMGIIGKVGTGKNRVIGNFLHRKNLAYAKLGPERISWRYDIRCCNVPVGGSLFALFLTYVIITFLSSYGLVVTLFNIDLAPRGNQSGIFEWQWPWQINGSEPGATVALCVSVGLLMLLLMVLMISVCVTLFCGDKAFSFANKLYHIYLVIIMVLCQIPRRKFDDEKDKFHDIPICFNSWMYAATDNLWATIVQAIFHKTEECFGKWKMRTYRILTSTLMTECVAGDRKLCQANKEETVVVKSSRWRKLVPYPILITIVLVIFTLSIVILVAVTVKEGMTTLSEAGDQAIEALAGSFIGVTVLSQIRNIYTVLKSFCTSQAAKMASLSKSSVISHDLGFMDEVKKEISKTMEFIGVMEQLYGKRFRILLIIEELDECQSVKIVEVFEALKLLLNDQGNPIVSIISLDPEPVIKALTLSEGGRDGLDELQKLCDMRFCMPRTSRHDVSKIMTMEAPDLKGSGAAQTLKHLQEKNKASKNCQRKQPDLLERNRVLKKDLITFALDEVKKNTDILHQNLAKAPQLLYSIRLSMACLATKLYPCEHKVDGEVTITTLRWICIELTRWLILCEQWPYRMSLIINSIVDENLPDSGNEFKIEDKGNTLWRHYSIVRQSLTLIFEWKQLIRMDDREELFQTGLKRFDHISSASVIQYLPLTFNVNRNIFDCIERYNSLKKSQET